MKTTQRVLRGYVPAALRKVAFLFEEDSQRAILEAAQMCEREFTLQTVEAAREIVHAAAHKAPIDSPAYAAGHAAAYAAAAVYVTLDDSQ